jgi:hypothetical protein
MESVGKGFQISVKYTRGRKGRYNYGMLGRSTKLRIAKVANVVISMRYA